MIKITNVKVPLGSDLAAVKRKIIKKLNISDENVGKFFVVKKSQDKRQKGNFLEVYSIALELVDLKEDDYLMKDVTIYKPPKYRQPKSLNTNKKVAVIGFGPCGMFASLILARSGLKPVVFERGEAVDNRILTVEKLKNNGIFNKDSNIQFGEGGAGTFSDGKLTTNIKDEKISFIIEEFVKKGASENIKIQSKPHIGTDYLIDIVKKIREEIISLDGSVNFNSKVVNIEKQDDKTILHIESETGIEKQVFDGVIFAIGHSARDTFKMVYDFGVSMESKPFSVGFRIEHTQDFINRCQYGNKYVENEKDIIPAEYKINTHLKNGRGVYTFCMCPGGEVVPSMSEENTVVTNGMSVFKRDSLNANSAVLVSVDEKDFLPFKEEGTPKALCGIDFQRHLEKLAFEIGGKNYFAPCQLTDDYLNNKKSETFKDVIPSYKPGTTFVNFNDYLPKELNESLQIGLKNLNNKISGFTKNGSVLTGFETRSSSPVKIHRNEKMFSNVEGVIFAGEGSGFAGGITTSALEGINSAENIIKYFNEVSCG